MAITKVVTNNVTATSDNFTSLCNREPGGKSTVLYRDYLKKSELNTEIAAVQDKFLCGCCFVSY